MNCNGIKLKLERVPSLSTSLQAWDAADKLALAAHELTVGDILVLNDHFGALACGLAISALDSQLYWVNDSYIAHQALVKNLALNGITKNITTFPQIEQLNAEPTGIILKLPR
ncbi:MAG: 50S rRNA methyltransferase, partial [Magnetococcales bacterium]|nr:50S rRNA methyltransferase [Magnetococcales bacterium]